MVLTPQAERRSPARTTKARANGRRRATAMAGSKRLAPGKVMFRPAGARWLGFAGAVRLLQFRRRRRDRLGVALALGSHVDREDSHRRIRLVDPVVRPVHRF